MSSKRINLKSTLGMRVYVRKTKLSPDEVLVLTKPSAISTLGEGRQVLFQIGY